MQPANKYLYGIDFGTSNSAIAIFDISLNEVVKTITVPSLLYFSNNQDNNAPLKYTVGKDAVSQYLEEGMKGRFMKSIKRILPRSSFIETRVYSEKMTAPDLVALILKELKKQADEYIGIEGAKVVLGRPVFFDDDDTAKDDLAQKRLLRAADQAGFTDIRLQYEPIAAAFTYERTITQKEKVLVADLGGGTTDFTFVQLYPNASGNDRRKDILATGGIYIGGDSFDSKFMMEKGTPYFGYGVKYESAPGKYLDLPLSFFTSICSWEKLNFFNSTRTRNDVSRCYSQTKQNRYVKNLITLLDNNLGYQVFQAAEQVKVGLSSKDKAMFSFSKLGIEIDESIALNTYNEIIKPDLAKIEAYLDKFLAHNNIKVEDVDTIFLTGGTSLVGAIQTLFRQKFPKSKFNSGDNFISVVKGLAYSGYLFE